MTVVTIFQFFYIFHFWSALFRVIPLKWCGSTCGSTRKEKENKQSMADRLSVKEFSEWIGLNVTSIIARENMSGAGGLSGAEMVRLRVSIAVNESESRQETYVSKHITNKERSQALGLARESLFYLHLARSIREHDGILFFGEMNSPYTSFFPSLFKFLFPRVLFHFLFFGEMTSPYTSFFLSLFKFLSPRVLFHFCCDL